MNPARLPLVIFLLGVSGAAVSLWISQDLGLVPNCRVYIDGCTSLSATGRREPAVFVFRATLVPTAVLMMLAWHLARHWLAVLDAGSNLSRHLVTWTGALSPIFLIVYLVLIGADGETVKQIRQWSIRVYFTAAILAKIGCALLLVNRHRTGPRIMPAWLPAVLLLVGIGLFLAVVLSVFLEHALDDPSIVHNLLQWHATTAFVGWYLLLGLAWRMTGFRLQPARRDES